MIEDQEKGGFWRDFCKAAEHPMKSCLPLFFEPSLVSLLPRVAEAVG